jgi:SAM-dependent methyltransferase
MLTGERYHQDILARPRDQRTRERFQRLALGLLPPGSRILDFGAGTGIDAKAYAAAGHIVWTYDAEDAQSAYLKQHCRDEIACRTIVPTPYPPAEKVSAVTANFAVLNLIPDLAALFESFSRILDEDGLVLVSLLNPYYIGDFRYDWWRANLLKLLREGQYTVGQQSWVHRYGPGAVTRAAAPHFRLADLHPHRAALWTQQYMVLLFRRGG